MVIWPGIIRWQERWEDSRTDLRFTVRFWAHHCREDQHDVSFLVHSSASSSDQEVLIRPFAVWDVRKEAAGIRRVYVTVEAGDVERE